MTTAKPFALEEDEPQRIAEAVGRMKLKHVVITAVARDDLNDGGAVHFARTIAAIREPSADTFALLALIIAAIVALAWALQRVVRARARAASEPLPAAHGS